MKKRTRMASLFVCVMILCSAFAPMAFAVEGDAEYIAATNMSAIKALDSQSPEMRAMTSATGYYITDLSVVGDEMTTDYGYGRMPRARRSMTFSGYLLDQDYYPVSGMEITAYCINVESNPYRYTTEYEYTDSNGYFEITVTSMPLCPARLSYYTGYSTHYFDISVWALEWYDGGYWSIEDLFYQLGYVISG